MTGITWLHFVHDILAPPIYFPWLDESDLLAVTIESLIMSDERYSFDLSDTCIKQVRTFKKSEHVVKMKVKNLDQKFLRYVIQLRIRIKQRSMSEDWFSWTAFPIPSRLCSLKLENNETGNNPNCVVCVVKNFEEGIAAPMFRVIRVDY